MPKQAAGTTVEPSARECRVNDRVDERRRAAALARHYREEENLAIAEIARRLGRAEATVKAYLYDPTGEKGARGQGPLRRGVPRLRRLHVAVQRICAAPHIRCSVPEPEMWPRLK